MAKSKELFETRNGYEIYLVTEQIPLAGKKGKPTTTIKTYSVMRVARIVKNRIATLDEARSVADQQPPV
jgi:hypothetical protein